LSPLFAQTKVAVEKEQRIVLKKGISYIANLDRRQGIINAET
jgi:hypothetical protein